MTIEVSVNGRSRLVRVESLSGGPGRFRVAWDGVSRVVDARRLDGSTLSLILSGEDPRSYQVRLDRRGSGTLAVHVGGYVIETVVNGGERGGWSRDAGSGAGAQRVTAPMPGKVVRLLVEVGDEVTIRQPLVVVEAMKMENELGAPRAGRVTEVATHEGASVETGKLLVVVE